MLFPFSKKDVDIPPRKIDGPLLVKLLLIGDWSKFPIKLWSFN